MSSSLEFVCARRHLLSCFTCKQKRYTPSGARYPFQPGETLPSHVLPPHGPPDWDIPDKFTHLCSVPLLMLLNIAIYYYPVDKYVYTTMYNYSLPVFYCTSDSTIYLVATAYKQGRPVFDICKAIATHVRTNTYGIYQITNLCDCSDFIYNVT